MAPHAEGALPGIASAVWRRDPGVQIRDFTSPFKPIQRKEAKKMVKCQPARQRLHGASGREPQKSARQGHEKVNLQSILSEDLGPRMNHRPHPKRSSNILRSCQNSKMNILRIYILCNDRCIPKVDEVPRGQIRTRGRTERNVRYSTRDIST